MSVGEDALTAATRRATNYAQALWRRRHGPPPTPDGLALTEVAQRLDLLINALFGRCYALRAAQPPAPPRLLAKLLGRRDGLRPRAAVPATDGLNIWLPARLDLGSPEDALARYRILALLQATRAARGSAAHLRELVDPLQRGLYLLLEAWAAETDLLARLPGLASPLLALRRDALAQRPPLSSCSGPGLALEGLLRRVLEDPGSEPLPGLTPPATPDDALRLAYRLARALPPSNLLGAEPLLRDCWTGDLRQPEATAPSIEVAEAQSPTAPPHTAHLPRSPLARRPLAGKDGQRQSGPWTVQAAQPREPSEEPPNLQRLADRQTRAAEDVADALAEQQTRLAVNPASPREIPLDDDPPGARLFVRSAPPTGPALVYPEWNFRSRSYRDPGATVHLCPAATGPLEWVERTQETHRALLEAVRRPFERLRAQRLRLRRQLDGDDIDLDAYTDALAQARAGLGMPQALYQLQRSSRRDLAILLLIDVSGSTDGWISSQRRIIDVEREALLLVCLALHSLGEPYAVQAFSGVGPQSVKLRTLKDFPERYGVAVARRIAALEPELYTRAGAAIRHASTCLMQQPATHRLLLLLSDGKPNDVDKYAGRYGVEDMRQAVNETRLRGIQPFCLTIDRQASGYLPAVFGARRYALLPNPERLPGVLLEWIRRLLAS